MENTLVLFSILSAVINAHKTVFPAMKLNELYKREKNEILNLLNNLLNF